MPQLPAEMKTPGEIIDYYIESKPIVVFSKSTCPYCKKAKKALATFKLDECDFEFVDLDKHKELDLKKFQDEFQVRYGTRTVPKVFIDGQLIGGGDDTVAMLKNGTLAVLVKEAIECE
ncbi:glutaredoxin [Ancylostoma ceylanicum]|uniref:Glutaredoxin n=1 Tax=Ancylostoma ceylanicum TaxID=53326 RepID=A0A0D6LI30_9BILA|nr:glutaredoxin [Ancylostoma ceylanicum]